MKKTIIVMSPLFSLVCLVYSFAKEAQLVRDCSHLRFEVNRSSPETGEAQSPKLINNSRFGFLYDFILRDQNDN